MRRVVVFCITCVIWGCGEEKTNEFLVTLPKTEFSCVDGTECQQNDTLTVAVVSSDRDCTTDMLQARSYAAIATRQLPECTSGACAVTLTDYRSQQGELISQLGQGNYRFCAFVSWNFTEDGTQNVRCVSSNVEEPFQFRIHKIPSAVSISTCTIINYGSVDE